MSITRTSPFARFESSYHATDCEYGASKNWPLTADQFEYSPVKRPPVIWKSPPWRELPEPSFLLPNTTSKTPPVSLKSQRCDSWRRSGKKAMLLGMERQPKLPYCPIISALIEALSNLR